MKLGEIHLISPNFMEFGEFHGIPPFWSINAVPAPPPQNALKTNAKLMVSEAIRPRITKLWPFWVKLVISGEFPPISRFRAKNALSRTFREISCIGAGTELGPARGKESGSQTASGTARGRRREAAVAETIPFGNATHASLQQHARSCCTT